MVRPHLIRASALVMACAALSLTGCSSTPKPAPGYLASVEVLNRDLQEIALVTTAVFREAGYHPTQPAGQHMVFERKGSTWKSIVYGDWSEGLIWYRAKVDILPPQDNRTVIACNASYVMDRGNAHFEEEKKVRGGGGEYQKLLDQVQARLAASVPN